MSEDEIVREALNILETRLRRPNQFFTSATDVKSYLKIQFSSMEYESFRVMFLNSAHGLISCEELFRGTINQAAVYPREVVKTALAFNAAAIVLSHNHPSGNANPSEADRQITKRIVDAMGLVDIRVLDHIVIAGGEVYSFAEHGYI